MTSIGAILKKMLIPLECCPACGGTGCEINAACTILFCQSPNDGTLAVIVGGKRIGIQRFGRPTEPPCEPRGA